ncbi:putative dehydrogenase [Klebsiella pneumoniae]|nr:putative dehydrogenase [Klebsiella pneumoniae]
MVLLEFAQSWARRKNTTPVQFALAWLMAQRPWIVPIPGTTQYPHLIENSGAPQVRLTDSELREIDAALAKIPLQGGRADPFTESQFDKKLIPAVTGRLQVKSPSVLLPGDKPHEWTKS